MTGNTTDPDAAPLLDAAHNIAEYTVGEIAVAVKRTLEGAFERVRVRGEISRPNYHGSGHLYFTLKDAGAALDGVCWRGNVARLGLTLEEGMEVVCTGRISSYPKSSRYQIVIESIELAGEGALLKLLEDRRRKLAAEGLFDEERKRPLPFLPEVIGVVTSPTGAVFRDILHRLADRFPRPVLLWPVPVQGDAAADQIAAAIKGFNALKAHAAVPRPDVIIVARGGGSLEDLMPFNEEVVVRAVAASEIPLISAVGHETDTTLIDFAADLRAPTPTAAAEMVVPVQGELLARVMEDGQRMIAAFGRAWQERRLIVDGLARGLPEPARLLEQAMQQLDSETDRLVLARDALLRDRRGELQTLAAGLHSPAALVARAEQTVAGLAERLPAAVLRLLQGAAERAASHGKLLDSLSWRGVLERGFALVRDGAGAPVLRAAALAPGAEVEIEFADGVKGARVHGKEDGDRRPRGQRRRKPASGSPGDDPQGNLL